MEEGKKEGIEKGEGVGGDERESDEEEKEKDASLDE